MNLIITNEIAISKLYDFYCDNGFENEADEIIKKVLKSNYGYYSEYSDELLKDSLFNFTYSELNNFKFNNNYSFRIFENYLRNQIEYLIKLSTKQMKKEVKELITYVLKEEFTLINDVYEEVLK